MESAYRDLAASLLSHYENVLRRRFFFNWLNKRYEHTLFKAWPCTLTLTHSYMKDPKKEEDPLIDQKLESALHMARMARGVEEEVKRPARGMPRGRTAAPRRGRAPARSEPRPAQPVELPNFSDKFAFTLSEESMAQVQDVKSRMAGGSFGGSGAMSKQKKAEIGAKKAFLSKLRGKFAAPRHPVDEQVSHAYSVYKIASEVKRILQDDDILGSFQYMSQLNMQQLLDPDAALQLFKAINLFKWVQDNLDLFHSLQVSQLVELPHLFRQLVAEASRSATAVEKLDGFAGEANILQQLKEACTKDEIKEAVKDFRDLQNWKIQSDTLKFILGLQEHAETPAHLKLVYSLLAPAARQIVTFAAK